MDHRRGRRRRLTSAGPCYYVATTGNDTTGDGSQVAPWATISKALATVPDEGATIKVAAGTYAENSGGLNYLYITRQFTQLCTVEPWYPGDAVLITDNGSGTYCVRYNGADHLQLKDVTIQQAAANTQATVFLQTSAMQNLQLTGCTIYARSGLGAVYAAAIAAAVTITLNHCTLLPDPEASGVVRMVYGRAVSGGNLSISLNNCSVTGNGVEAIDVQQGHAAGTYTLAINGGTYTNTGDYAILVQGGTIRVAGATVTAGTWPAFVVGADGAATYATAGTISGCTIQSASGHSLLLGGSSSVVATGCTIVGGDHAVVLKLCDGSQVLNSNLTGGTLSAVYFKGATNATVDGDTIAGAAGSLVQVGEDPTVPTPCSNLTFTDNTVTATGSASIFAFAPDGAGDDSGGSVCDRNAYDISGTTGTLGNVLGTAAIDTLAALQAAWDTYDQPNNDDNSTVVS